MLTKKDHSVVLFFFLLFLQRVSLHVEVDILYQKPPTMTVLEQFESSNL